MTHEQHIRMGIHDPHCRQCNPGCRGPYGKKARRRHRPLTDDELDARNGYLDRHINREQAERVRYGCK